MQLARPTPPNADKRWKMVDVTMRRNGYSSHALIEALHKVQSSFGYLDEPAMAYVADALSLPLSKVYGVATFYHLFTLKPQGKHTCVLCTGTACYIKGSQDLIDGVRERHGIGPGETTGDKSLSAISARCIGACGLAPAAVVDGEVLGNLTADKLLSEVEKVI